MSYFPVLKPREERPRAPSPAQKENNIVLAKKQQNMQQKYVLENM